MRRHRRRDYVIAGIGIGLAAATKYTGGITMMCLLVAAFLQPRRRADRLVARPWRWLWSSPWARSFSPTRTRCSISPPSPPASPRRPRSPPGGPGEARHDPWEWHHLLPVDVHVGAGVGPALAAVGGAGAARGRKRLGMLLILVPAPIAFIIFMGDQQRFFGRWLMPIFPDRGSSPPTARSSSSAGSPASSRVPRPVCGGVCSPRC